MDSIDGNDLGGQEDLAPAINVGVLTHLPGTCRALCLATALSALLWPSAPCPLWSRLHTCWEADAGFGEGLEQRTFLALFHNRIIRAAGGASGSAQQTNHARWPFPVATARGARAEVKPERICVLGKGEPCVAQCSGTWTGGTGWSPSPELLGRFPPLFPMKGESEERAPCSCCEADKRDAA